MTDDDRIADPFHAGELQAQRRAGVDAGQRKVPIRHRLPQQHRAFYPLLPFVALAASGGDGWPLATLLQGSPGFVTAPDDGHLALAARPDADDPLHARIVAGAQLGLLGIDLATRRRNRANGLVAATSPDGFTLAVAQCFGNCPRHIGIRALAPLARARSAPLAFEGVLPARARQMIADCATLFVASGGADGTLDIAHRGGAPGFVGIEGALLSVPDYAGNRYYNTLGNFIQEPRAAMVLADFASGDLLHLQGLVEIDWTASDPALDPPVERRWRMRVVRGCLRPGAFGLGEGAGASPVPDAAATTGSATLPAHRA